MENIIKRTESGESSLTTTEIDSDDKNAFFAHDTEQDIKNQTNELLGICKENDDISEKSQSTNNITRAMKSGLSFNNTMISFRDTSSIAMSECTKPDPPSIIDHKVIYDKTNSDNENDRILDNHFRSGSDFDLVISSFPDSGSFVKNAERSPKVRDSNNNSSILKKSNPESEGEILDQNTNKKSQQLSDKKHTTEHIQIDRNVSCEEFSSMESQTDLINSSKNKQNRDASKNSQENSTPKGQRVCMEPKADFKHLEIGNSGKDENSVVSRQTQLEPNATHSNSFNLELRQSKITNESSNKLEDLNQSNPVVRTNHQIDTSNFQVTKSDQFFAPVGNGSITEPVSLSRGYGIEEEAILPPVDENSASQIQRLPVQTSYFEQERQYMHNENQGTYGYNHSPTVPMGTNSNAPTHQALTMMSLNGISHAVMMTNTGGTNLPVHAPMSNGGRRKIFLRLEEDVVNTQQNNKSKGFRNGILGHIRKKSSSIMSFGGKRRGQSLSSFDDLDHLDNETSLFTAVSRGKITVSWYEGTSSLELQEHVRRCVVRKLVRSQGVSNCIELDDLRILDETIEPPEGKKE